MSIYVFSCWYIDFNNVPGLVKITLISNKIIKIKSYIYNVKEKIYYFIITTKNSLFALLKNSRKKKKDV